MNLPVDEWGMYLFVNLVLNDEDYLGRQECHFALVLEQWKYEVAHAGCDREVWVLELWCAQWSGRPLVADWEGSSKEYLSSRSWVVTWGVGRGSWVMTGGVERGPGVMTGESGTTIKFYTDIGIVGGTSGVFMIFNTWMWSLATVLAFTRTRNWKTSLDMSLDGLERVVGNTCRKRFSNIWSARSCRHHTVQKK